MIELSDLTVRLGGAPVLQSVSLSVGPGRILALIGPSGAGKSVLLKALCGLVPHAGGRVRVCDEPVTGRDEPELFPVRERVGMLFQGGALFDHLSVFDNVAFPLRRRGRPDEEVGTRVRAQLEAVGLASAADRLPRDLSGGMRKRTGIARALVIDPEVGLWDEPVAGLDPVTSARILRLVTRARDTSGMASIACGHDLPALLSVADEVAMLDHGRLIHHGPVAELPHAPDPRVRAFVQGAEEGLT